MHDELGVVLAVEAGRGARGNAVYRDLIRTSLIVGVRYLALGVVIQYRHQSGGIMIQQTKGLGGGRANPWPYPKH